jgi:hypothetical protein
MIGVLRTTYDASSLRKRADTNARYTNFTGGKIR